MRSTLVATLALASLLACNDSKASVTPHIHGTHGGMVTAFRGTVAGYLELKLHDDKGDIECWLSQDPDGQRPFDLPLNSSLELEFTDHAGRKLSLRPRNSTNNEDEDGKPSVRDGKTNYFIFPTQPGEDASWLKGKQFHAMVTVSFTHGNAVVRSHSVKLAPHSH